MSHVTIYITVIDVITVYIFATMTSLQVIVSQKYEFLWYYKIMAESFELE